MPSSYSHLVKPGERPKGISSSVCLRKPSPATSQDKSGFSSSKLSEVNTLRQMPWPAFLACRGNSTGYSGRTCVRANRGSVSIGSPANLLVLGKSSTLRFQLSIGTSTSLSQWSGTVARLQEQV